MTEIRRAFAYNAQYAILVRGTADQVALAEKLIQDLDKPKAEVVVDVDVMEANRSRVRDLAATFTTGGAPGINVPIVRGRTGMECTGMGMDGDGTGTGRTGTGTGTVRRRDRQRKLDTGGRAEQDRQYRDRRLLDDRARGLIKASADRQPDTSDPTAASPRRRNAEGSLRIGDRIPYASGAFSPASVAAASA